MARGWRVASDRPAYRSFPVGTSGFGELSSWFMASGGTQVATKSTATWDPGGCRGQSILSGRRGGISDSVLFGRHNCVRFFPTCAFCILHPLHLAPHAGGGRAGRRRCGAQSRLQGWGMRMGRRFAVWTVGRQTTAGVTALISHVSSCMIAWCAKSAKVGMDGAGKAEYKMCGCGRS